MYQGYVNSVSMMWGGGDSGEQNTFDPNNFDGEGW